MPRLPPELIDHIIGYLHDSVWDLRTCAIVSKSWLELSRARLFSSIEMYESSRCIKLYEAIQQSPSIAFHVRELVFWDDVVYYGMPLELDGICQLLRSFTRLCELNLHFLRPTALIPDVRRCVRDILALPTLVRFNAFLDLYRQEYLTDLFHPHLKWLHASIATSMTTPTTSEREICNQFNLITREVEMECEPEAALERQPCRLDHLEWNSAYEGHGFLDWLLGTQSTVDVSNLHTLIVRADEEEMKRLVRLVGSVGPSLEHLTVEALDCTLWKTFPDEASCGYKPNLKELSLTAHFCPQGARCLMSLLSNLEAPNIEQISFRLWSPEDEVDTDIDMFWDDWIEVFRIFDSQPLSLLRCLKVAPNPDPERFRQRFVEHFPSLASKAVVEFS